MAQAQHWKVLQKRAYDLFSYRYGALVVFCGLLLVIVSAFQFGEVVMEWSSEKYAAVFNSFSDNIAGRSFRERLCLPVPIDIVYTWVNGTDPKLLMELRKYKVAMEHEINATRGNQTSDTAGTCTFSNCIPATIAVIEPALPRMVNIDRLAILYPGFANAAKIYTQSSPLDSDVNVTVVEFDSNEFLEAALKETIVVSGKNVTVKQAYYTSDWTLQNSVLLHDTILMNNIPEEYTSDDLRKKIPEKLQKSVTKIIIIKEKSMAVIWTNNKEDHELLVDGKNMTIDGKQPTIHAANLVWDLNDYSLTEDVAANRYEDNEELRYSLRSVEQHLPWVRQIFLVTNGQIPSWLNLDNPRLIVVTHKEIFRNQSHLPTFASPSIESHIHRIPGLSDKFIYMNDDVMFGRDVWPDDFYTHSRGQKVYLTWPVPNCQDGCPSTWIKDGYCDKACNNSECEWDGGDCAGGGSNSINLGGGGWAASQSEQMYCNTGCANNWIADRYCDNSCNVPQCGYDAGDCGIDHYNKMYSIAITKDVSKYTLPAGEYLVWFNLTSLLGNDSNIVDGNYHENDVIRRVAIAKKFNVITAVLYPNKNATTLEFNVKVKNKNETEIAYNFNVSVDTRPVPKTEEVKVKTKNTTTNDTKPEAADNKEDKVEVFIFDEVPDYLQKARAAVLEAEQVDIEDVKLIEYELPQDIDDSLQKLVLEFTNGEITESGFLKRQWVLWQELKDRLAVDGKVPQKSTHKPVQDEEVNNGDADDKHADVNDQVEKRAIEEDQGNNVHGEAQEEHIGEGQGNNGHEEAQGGHKGEGNGNQKVGEDGVVNEKSQLKEVDKEKEDLVLKGADNVDDQNRIKHEVKVDTKLEAAKYENVDNDGDLVEEAIANQYVDKKQPAKADNDEQFDVQGKDLIGNEKPIVHNVDKVVPESENKENEGIGGDGNLKNKDTFVDYVEKKQEQVLGKGDEILRQQLDEKKRLNQTKDDIAHLKQNASASYKMEDGVKTRKLNGLGGDDDVGFLPWERAGEFTQLQKQKEAQERQQEYTMNIVPQRRLQDAFSHSLRHVNKLYNKAFGYSARKVPAHMPHMVDKNIMADLQTKFPVEWDVTSGHKIRSSTDMQFAFSYFYYLMSEANNFSIANVFDNMDSDHNLVLSDREIRTLATRLYELPLTLQILTGLENMFINCSQHLKPESHPPVYPEEKYYEDKMPQVTRYLFINCPDIVELARKNFGSQTKYKYEIMGDDEVTFKMVRTNVSHVVGQLDDIRKHPKKFICLNDNIEHHKEGAKTVKAVLQDFYESMFPIPSSFELPRDYRNRFLHIDELREWRKYRDWLKTWTQMALVLLVMFTIASFFSDKIEELQRRLVGRRRPSGERSMVQTV